MNAFPRILEKRQKGLSLLLQNILLEVQDSALRRGNGKCTDQKGRETAQICR